MLCDFLTAKFVYEKEFYFFDKFTVSNSEKCGNILTYILKDSSNNVVGNNDAIIDEVQLVPGKMRIFFKDASVVGNTDFTVEGKNAFGATVTS